MFRLAASRIMRNVFIEYFPSLTYTPSKIRSAPRLTWQDSTDGEITKSHLQSTASPNSYREHFPQQSPWIVNLWITTANNPTLTCSTCEESATPITQWTDGNNPKPQIRSVDMSWYIQSCGPEMLQAIGTCAYVVVVDVARAHYHRCPIANRDVRHRVIWRLDTGESTKQDKPMVIF